MSDGSQPVRGLAAVHPGLGELPGGRDDEDIVPSREGARVVRGLEKLYFTHSCILPPLW